MFKFFLQSQVNVQNMFKFPNDPMKTYMCISVIGNAISTHSQILDCKGNISF